jgi:hypothetical protein
MACHRNSPGITKTPKKKYTTIQDLERVLQLETIDKCEISMKLEA